MNYYKRHLGDYAKKAGHLSMLEHGAYNLILDAYYDREEPLTESLAIRLARATTNEEIQAVKNILREFFSESEGVFTQNRADEEIASFHKRQKINKKLGAKGGLAKGKRIAKRNDSESLASHKPLAISHKEEKKAADAASPEDRIWSAGVSYLCGRGSSEGGARAFLGKLVKAHKAVPVLDALEKTIEAAPAEPKAYLVKLLTQPSGPRPWDGAS